MSERVIVVGAGIAGAAVALALRRRGLEVVVLERSGPGGGEPGPAATGASAGMLAPQYEAHGRGPVLDLAVASRRRHPEFLRRIESLAGVDLGLREDGMLVPAFTPAEEEAAKEAVGWQRDMGLEARVLPADEAAALQPGVTPEARCWTWLPGEAWLDTQRLAGALVPALDAAGVAIRAPTEVAGIVLRGGRLRGVALEDGTSVEAERVVLAAGSWTGRLADLPREVPVRPVRGQVLRYAARGAPLLRRLVAGHGGRYLVPRPDGGILAGSTMEEAGFAAKVTGEGTRRVAEGAERLLPAMRTCPVERSWAGLRPLSRDDVPILGPDPEVPGLHYATGYGRNGILLAPEAGELVAALVAGEEPPADPAPFSIGRFGCG